MAAINLNDLAKKITLKEGGKVNLPIGQVKEVMRLTFEEMAVMDMVTIDKLLNKHRKKKR